MKFVIFAATTLFHAPISGGPIELPKLQINTINNHGSGIWCSSQ